MIKKFLFLAVCVSMLAVVSTFGQGGDASIKPVYVKGEVVSVDSAKLVVKTDTGQWQGVVSDKTQFKRVSPDNPTDLKGAAPAVIGDIGPGDKIVLSALAGTGGQLNVRNVYLMTKSDLSAKQQKDADKWRNGISGRVTSVKADANQVVVETGSVMNKVSLTLTAQPDAKFIRYSPNSVQFADAKPSSINEIKTGDQIRAIGDKSADGLTFTANEILTGGFRQTAGKIKSIDAEKKEAVIEDLATKKDVTISFANAVFLKKFPAEMATRMAGAQMGGGAGGGVRPPGGGNPPAGGGVQQGGGRPDGAGGGFRPGGGAGGGGTLDAMVDRMPNITAADLKVGDMIAVLTGGPVTPNATVNALKLLAGVEPFIEMAQRQAAAAGARGAANGPNFNIPGLDAGIGNP
ncbi:MAG: hypothetical protein JO314_01145 [Acidobacteria bacterium]|nr:hypothetical protein [Acidobacteriota bacterium]